MVNTQGLRNAAVFMRQQTEVDVAWLTNAADEIDRLRKALRDVMNAANDPYEVARAALSSKEDKRV